MHNLSKHLKKVVIYTMGVSLVVACASKPQIAVDPRSVVNQEKYEQDLSECTGVAENYDLTEGTAKTAIVGAAAGGGAAAGVAAAVAGAIFWPAIPFIAGAAVVTATGSGGVVKVKEADARETILADCMTERGYKTFKATNSANSTPAPQPTPAKPDSSPISFTEPQTNDPVPRPPKSDFAKLDNVNAVPGLSEDKKKVYRKFLNEPLPRAFAISDFGSVGWASRSPDSMSRALYFCQVYAKQSCRLYAVDNDVVWTTSEQENQEKQ